MILTTCHWDGHPSDRNAQAAGQRLLENYAGLAERKEHLLGSLLDGQLPRQWSHYPEDDAIDEGLGYQWFYHSHSPADRIGSTEHGHFHLFARRKLWSRHLQSKSERQFASMTGDPDQRTNTRHLIAISLNAAGIPISIFTVNSWVTGDLMLAAGNTDRLRSHMTLDTGHPEIDAVLKCVVALSRDEILDVLMARDNVLSAYRKPGLLRDESLEILSEVPINLDQRLAALGLF